MIHLIKSLSDPRSALLKDDPVRPHIHHEIRFGDGKFVFALMDESIVKAISCAKICQTVPRDEAELFDAEISASILVFYTIWSYKLGAGQQLIRDGLDYAREHLPEITKFVTLSPLTETARKFHLRNGATVFRTNLDSVNYEYQLR